MNTEKVKTEEKRYSIETGPSRDTLFDACKYAHSETAKFTVDFGVALGYTMPQGNSGCAYIRMAIADVMIVGIEHESGSGESLNLFGYCKADLCPVGRSGPTYKSYRFEAQYDSKRRKGSIAFI